MLAEVQQLSEDAAKLAAAALWPLADDELTACLRAADALEKAAAVLQLRLVQQANARELPAQQGERGTARWLREQLRLDPQPAREIAERAAVLSGQPTLEQAMVDGLVDVRQAAAIAATVDNVTSGLAELDDVSLAEAADVAAQARDTMIEMARRLPAYQLRRIGERILAHVAPHLAERADELLLARQEARARAARRFTMSFPVDGLVRLSGALGVEDAAVVQAALDPLCGPRPDDERSPEQRRADALTDVCRLALRTGDLPATGGEPAQLAVTVAYDPLTQTLSTATTDAGARLSAATARRLACDARIMPVVLGGTGQVLDLGRSHRLATGAVRKALQLRDQGCAFPDCDLPPRWTDAHHIVSWTDGGPTSLDNLVLLCRRHHRLIHHPTAEWRVRLGPDQQPEFVPPPHVDAAQRPLRNIFHRRQ